MADNIIKQINVGGTTYNIRDAATAEVAAQNTIAISQTVKTINGYTYDQINGATPIVKFADTAITNTEIGELVSAIDTTGN